MYVCPGVYTVPFSSGAKLSLYGIGVDCSLPWALRAGTKVLQAEEGAPDGLASPWRTTVTASSSRHAVVCAIAITSTVSQICTEHKIIRLYIAITTSWACLKPIRTWKHPSTTDHVRDERDSTSWNYYPVCMVCVLVVHSTFVSHQKIKIGLYYFCSFVFNLAVIIQYYNFHVCPGKNTLAVGKNVTF